MLVFLISAVIFTIVGFSIRKKIAESKMKSAENEAKRIIELANKEAENKKKEEIFKAKEEIITARNEQKLFEVRNEILNNMYLANKEKNNRVIKKIKQDIDIKVISANLENEKEVFELYEKIKDEDIDVFINNAGFGTAGSFWETDLNTEINMVKVNDIAMHILFKLILKNMLNVENKKIAANIEENQKNDKSPANNWKGINNEKNSGNKKQDLSDEKYILNVSSLSGFMPGPKMSVYYATKAYMLNLTRGVYKELKMAKAKVNVSVLCPGPVYTNFADRAGVLFKTPKLSSEYTAKWDLILKVKELRNQ